MIPEPHLMKLADGSMIVRYVNLDIAGGELSGVTGESNLQLAGTTPFTDQINIIAARFQASADELLAAFAV